MPIDTLTDVTGQFLGELESWLVQHGFAKKAPSFLRAGTGSPETIVTGPVGSLWLRTDGGAGTTLYVKESGAGNTGWIGK